MQYSLSLRRASPAIDGGFTALCPGFDVDKLAPVDADRDGSAECDIGSFEWGAR